MIKFNKRSSVILRSLGSGPNRDGEPNKRSLSLRLREASSKPARNPDRVVLAKGK